MLSAMVCWPRFLKVRSLARLPLALNPNRGLEGFAIDAPSPYYTIVLHAVK
jgi:hypothetical protein